jgi:hypothetical protein
MGSWAKSRTVKFFIYLCVPLSGLALSLRAHEVRADEQDLLQRLLQLEVQMLTNFKSAPFVQDESDIVFFQCPGELKPGGVKATGEGGLSWWANKPFHQEEGPAYAASRRALLSRFEARAEENYVVVPNDVPMEELALGVVKVTKKGFRFLPLEMGATAQKEILLLPNPPGESSLQTSCRSPRGPSRRGHIALPLPSPPSLQDIRQFSYRGVVSAQSASLSCVGAFHSAQNFNMQYGGAPMFGLSLVPNAVNCVTTSSFPNESTAPTDQPLSRAENPFATDVPGLMAYLTGRGETLSNVCANVVYITTGCQTHDPSRDTQWWDPTSPGCDLLPGTWW